MSGADVSLEKSAILWTICRPCAERYLTSVFAGRVGRHSSGITQDQASILLTFGDGSMGQSSIPPKVTLASPRSTLRRMPMENRSR